MENSLHLFLLLLVAAIVSSATAAKHRGQSPSNEITEIKGGTKQAGSSAPIPKQAGSSAPIPKQAGSSAPIPKQAGSSAPIPKQAGSSAPIPKQAGSSAPIPKQAGSSAPIPKQPLSRKPSGSGSLSIKEPKPKGPLPIIADPAKFGSLTSRLRGSHKENNDEGQKDKAKGKNLTPKNSRKFLSGRNTVELSSSPQLSRNSSKTSSRTSDNEMTEEELKAIFNSFDANKDGKITQQELGALMTALENPLKEKELAVALELIDTDGDGMISLEEFKNTFKPNDIEDLKVAFKTFAQGKDFIMHSDLIRVSEKSNIEMTPREATNILAKYGKQSGGQTINFSEFCKMMVQGVFNE